MSDATSAASTGGSAPATGVKEAILSLGKKARLVGLVGGVALLVGLILALCGIGTNDFFLSYTIGYMYVLAFGLGCLGLNLLHCLSGGRWGFSIKRILLAGQATVPLLAALFLPLLAAMLFTDFYPWEAYFEDQADHEHVAAAASEEAAAEGDEHAHGHHHDPILDHKAVYLNKTGWILRAIFFFAAWGFIAWIIRKRWDDYESSGWDAAKSRRLRVLGGPLIVLYVLSMTFAALDWVMSLEPHWFSTIYGALFVVGQALTVWAFSLVVLNWLKRRDPEVASQYGNERFHDISALMFAFIVLWTYMTFAQFMIIWSANIPEETPWYLHRSSGGWQVLACFLILFHFALPFLLLLRLRLKTDPNFLYVIGGGMLLMRAVDLFWVIKPALKTGEDHGHALHAFNLDVWDFVAPVALLGIWLSVFAKNFAAGPLVVLEKDGELKKGFEEAPTPLQAEMAR